MSATPIDRSEDLLRLRRAGYEIRVTGGGLLLLSHVPYVNDRKEIAFGTLVSNLDLAGDATVQPKDHTLKFIGEYPCDSSGVPLPGLRHSSQTFDLGDGVVAQHLFSRKPGRGHYLDYYEKMTTYVALLDKHAMILDPSVTARTGRVIEPEESDSPFNYLDTASSRAEISPATAKLADEAVAIVGLGGTGSYVLDLLAKTPIRKIHLFDADRLLTHNAFRAPGAPHIDQLRDQPLKVDYYSQIYSRMHRGIQPHPYAIDATTVDELKGMSFVFLCMEGGSEKRAAVELLEAQNIAFCDVGMALYVKRNSVGGLLRTVLSLPDGRQQARTRITFSADDAANDYDKNIQIADLNALNACFAVMAWKKLRGFYFDLGHERFTSLSVANTLLAKSDVA